MSVCSFTPNGSGGCTCFGKCSLLPARNRSTCICEAAFTSSAPPPQAVSAVPSDFEICPNPLSGNSFTLKLPTEDIDKYTEITLTDIQGRPCLRQNLSSPFESKRIETDAGPADGVCIVELQGAGRSTAKKLVIKW